MRALFLLREHGPGCLLGAGLVVVGLLAFAAWANEPGCVVDDPFQPRVCGF
jgi:hypothetical protein